MILFQEKKNCHFCRFYGYLRHLRDQKQNNLKQKKIEKKNKFVPKKTLLFPKKSAAFQKKIAILPF